MAYQETGVAPPPKGKGRAVLSVRDPIVETLLGGLGVDGEELEHLRAVCKGLSRSRNRWDIERRKRGVFFPGRLSKDDAGKALRNALAKIGGER